MSKVVVILITCAAVVVTGVFTFWGGSDAVQSGTTRYFGKLIEKNNRWGH
ncbi:hypothetical protein [Brevibacillus dissolubilis]|nr:hypothetical protein [Brevibacillus dissolubilis]